MIQCHKKGFCVSRLHSYCIVKTISKYSHCFSAKVFLLWITRAF
jgi:hypothetical protein